MVWCWNTAVPGDDLANVTWELSKVNFGASKTAFLKMRNVIKYVLNIKNLGLKIEPAGDDKEPWDIICFINSYYTGDQVTR